MKKTFKEFYNPNYKELWNTCVFVFDTNVLLNLYRYKAETKDAFFKVLEVIGENKWLPYQVGYEYHKNRLEVIHEIKNKSNELKKDTEKNIENIKNNFEKITKQSSLSKRDEDFLNSSISELEKLTIKYNKKAEDKYNNLKNNDIIQEKLIELFELKIGDNYSEEQIESLYKEAHIRFEKKIPPGFEDMGKDGNDKYSDFIIWRQILDYAKTNNKNLVFVTADEKKDWWSFCKGEKHCCPKLKKEFYKFAGTEFHMYTPEKFIDEAKEFFNLNYSDEIIEEVKRVRRPAPMYTLAEIDFDEDYKRRVLSRIIRVALRKTKDPIDFINYLCNRFNMYFIPPLMDIMISLKRKYDESEIISSSKFNKVINYIIRNQEQKENEIKQPTLFDFDNSEDN